MEARILMQPVALLYENILDMIGNTPMVEVCHIDTGPCRLFLKLENQNPGGSIKDRIGKSMIEAAERLLRPPPGIRVLASPWLRPKKATNSP